MQGTWLPQTHHIVEVNTSALTTPDGKKCVDKCGYIGYTQGNNSTIYYWQIRKDTYLDLSTVYAGLKCKVKTVKRNDRLSGWDWALVEEIVPVKKQSPEVVLDNELFSRPPSTKEKFAALLQKVVDEDQLTEAQMELLTFLADNIDSNHIKFK